MDFDFLSKLHKSDLDDRNYKDLVDECVLRIPRYTPEWSNFNPSDPGITMIELFAWLTDQMLLRFNQVPRRNYVAFLEMLGITLQAATPAETEITFYLSRPQSHEVPIPAIAPGTEVATERTETNEAIVFSTEESLNIGVPKIRHCLTANEAAGEGEEPTRLRDRFENLWTQDDVTGHWSGPEQFVFQEAPQHKNCFYLVFDGDEPLDGNVIVLDIEGEPAGSTGINPRQPPRSWEAWDGECWQRNILLTETDDGSNGFSFSDNEQSDTSGVRQATIRLHLPLRWPITRFDRRYSGRWLRCVYEQPNLSQANSEVAASRYDRSPKLTKISVYAIGGTAPATQCMLIQNELVGESNGKPGQKMKLISDSILWPRTTQERLIVQPPGVEGLPQTWTEVSDFSASTVNDLHYTLNSITGEIQFGPLIREPEQLKQEVQVRRDVQEQGKLPGPGGVTTVELLKRQRGAVPPRGATVRMLAYRTGGGRLGNVHKQAIRILKSAVPYVTQVVNYKKAVNGADAESLEEAVIRVPSLLRTRDRAVTPEDFETLTLRASRAVARAYCSHRQETGKEEIGKVRVVVVPRVESETVDTLGISPDAFNISEPLRKEILDFLNERRVLGIEILLKEPTYVGVSVQANIGLKAGYTSKEAQEKVKAQLRSRLYRFLNPLASGLEEIGLSATGWKFGTPVYKSDITRLLQSVPEVQYIRAVELFSIKKNGDEWERLPATQGMISPGEQGLICSWADDQLRSGHDIDIASQPLQAP